jgi:ABC-type Co2+ transport system permease subunit
MKRRILFLGVLAAALIAAVAIFFPTTGSLSKALVSSDDATISEGI